MASGAPRLQVGNLAGTGSKIVVTLGFRPSYVKLFNVSAACTLAHFASMPADSGMKVNTAAAWIASGGITITDTGFEIGTDADLNTSGEKVHYITL